VRDTSQRAEKGKWRNGYLIVTYPTLRRCDIYALMTFLKNSSLRRCVLRTEISVTSAIN